MFDVLVDTLLMHDKRHYNWLITKGYSFTVLRHSKYCSYPYPSLYIKTCVQLSPQFRR